jgi:hypothetical protein
VRFHPINDKILEETKMRKIRYEFLLIAGLIMTLGCTAVFANGKDKVKRPKNSGILSVKADQAYTVRINGEEVGMSGVNEPAEFYLRPDNQAYTVEIVGKDGKVLWVDDGVLIKKNRKYCICLRTIDRAEKLCPYDYYVKGPDRVKEGAIVTLTAVDAMEGNTLPLTFRWEISAGTILEGQGTNTITVDTAGMGGKTINAIVDVNDGMYKQCQQGKPFVTDIEPTIIERPYSRICDEFPEPKADELKARLENCSLSVLNLPDSELYIIIYPAPGKKGNEQATYNRLYNLTYNYLVKNRKMDPSRVTIIKGPTMSNTRFKIWIFPAGAETPVP